MMDIVERLLVKPSKNFGLWGLRKEAADEIERLRAALEVTPAIVPTTWLDPLLSGSKAIKVNNEHDGVAKVLLAIHVQIQEHVDKALKQPENDIDRTQGHDALCHMRIYRDITNGTTPIGVKCTCASP